MKSLTENPIEWDKEPCPYCGGKVIYTSNAYIYHGRTYGNGMCYVCTNCKASVGVHSENGKGHSKNSKASRRPLGILATQEMKPKKTLLHNRFDNYWQNQGYSRGHMYATLAKAMGIPHKQCHFGWFIDEDLDKANRVLEDWEENPGHFLKLYNGEGKDHA